MTLVIDLTKSDEIRLAAAAEQEGIAPSAWVQNLIAKNLPVLPTHESDPMLALFAKWDAEDARLTPEEVATEDQQWQQFKHNINAERDRAGARRVF